MRFAGSVKLRPVRLGFLVPPGDLAVVRRVIRLSACVWGGRYNPIIPFFEGASARWARPWKSASGREVARGYIDFFEPDVLVEASAGMAADLGWEDTSNSFGSPRIVSLGEFYDLDERGRVEFAAGIDILNVMKHLYDREYKYQQRHKVPFAKFETSEASAYFDIVLGAYPDDPAIRYIEDAYRDVFEPEVLPANATTALRLVEKGLAGPNWITRFGLEEGLGRGRSDHTILIFDPTDPGDLIDAWNYRLIEREAVPISVAWLPEHASLLREQIQAVHRPIPGNASGLNFRTHVNFARSISDQTAQALLAQHFGGLADGAFYWGRDPDIWPLAGNPDRWREKRILVSAKAESFDIEVNADGYAKIPALAPEFHNATRAYRRARWMNVVSPSISRLDEDAAVVYPSNLWKPDPQGLGLAHTLTITREGWTIPEEHASGYSLLRPVSGRDALVGWFKARGIEAYPSEEGQVATQIIAAAGNLLACGMFADAKTLHLLNEMAESHAEPTRDRRSVRAVGPDRARHVNRIEQHFQQRSKRGFGFWTQLDYFLKRSVFRAGLNVKCPTCAHHNWFDLDTAGYALTCTRCLKPFKFAEAPTDLRKVEWFYRVIGPFAAPDFARGGYAVALTLRCLAENRHNELTWSTGLVLKELEEEIDFAGWYRRGSLSDGEKDEPVLVIGEVKSFGRNAIGDDAVRSLRMIAERFPEAILVVSSLKPIADYSAAEIERLTDLANFGRSRAIYSRPQNPLIILTATELLCEHGIAQAWKKSGGRAAELVKAAYVDLSDLYTLAEATQQLYLNMPPFYEDYCARLKAGRVKLFNLIRTRAKS